MKSNKIVLLALALTAGITANAQEKNETRIARENNISKTKAIGLPNTSQTPEQIATAKTEKLKGNTVLSSEQEVSVKNLFLKIENRKAALTNLSEQEKANSLKELQEVEDRELKAILAPSQQKMKSETKATTKNATSM